jgi:hypothetical protein
VVASINKNTIKQVSEVDAVIQLVKLAFNEMSKVRTVRRAFRVKIQDEVASEVFRNQIQKMVKHSLRSRGSILEEEGGVITQIKAFRQRVQNLMSSKTQLPEVDSLEYL